MRSEFEAGQKVDSSFHNSGLHHFPAAAFTMTFDLPM